MSNYVVVEQRDTSPSAGCCGEGGCCGEDAVYVAVGPALTMVMQMTEAWWLPPTSHIWVNLLLCK